MKLSEIRLYDLKVVKNDEVIYEGSSEALPEELKGLEGQKYTLENGEVTVIVG